MGARCPYGFALPRDMVILNSRWRQLGKDKSIDVQRDLIGALAMHSHFVVSKISEARQQHFGTLNDGLSCMRRDMLKLDKSLVRKLRLLDIANKVLRHTTVTYLHEVQKELCDQLDTISHNAQAKIQDKNP